MADWEAAETGAAVTGNLYVASAADKVVLVLAVWSGFVTEHYLVPLDCANAGPVETADW